MKRIVLTFLVCFTVSALECPRPVITHPKNCEGMDIEDTLGLGKAKTKEVAALSFYKCLDSLESNLCELCTCQWNEENKLSTTARERGKFADAAKASAQKAINKKMGEVAYIQMMQTILLLGQVRSFLNLTPYKKELKSCTLGQLDQLPPSCKGSAKRMDELFSQDVLGKNVFGINGLSPKLDGSDLKTKLSSLKKHFAQVASAFFSDKPQENQCLSYSDIFSLSDYVYNKEFDSYRSLFSNDIADMESVSGVEDEFLLQVFDRIVDLEGLSDSDYDALEKLNAPEFKTHPLYTLFANDTEYFKDFLRSFKGVKDIHHWSTQEKMVSQVVKRLSQQCAKQMSNMKGLICDDDRKDFSFDKSDMPLVEAVIDAAKNEIPEDPARPFYALSLICQKSAPQAASLMASNWESKLNDVNEFSKNFVSMMDLNISVQQCDDFAKKLNKGRLRLASTASDKGKSDLERLYSLYQCDQETEETARYCDTLKKFQPKKGKESADDFVRQRIAHKTQAFGRDASPELKKEYARELEIYASGGESSTPIVSFEKHFIGSIEKPTAPKITDRSLEVTETEIVETNAQGTQIPERAQTQAVAPKTAPPAMVSGSPQAPAHVMKSAPMGDSAMASAIADYFKNTMDQRVTAKKLDEIAEKIVPATAKAIKEPVKTVSDIPEASDDTPLVAAPIQPSRGIVVGPSGSNEFKQVAQLPEGAYEGLRPQQAVSAFSDPMRNRQIVETTNPTAGNLQELVGQDQGIVGSGNDAEEGIFSIFSGSSDNGDSATGTLSSALERLKGALNLTNNDEVESKNDVVIDLDPKLSELDLFTTEGILTAAKITTDIDIRELLKKAQPIVEGEPFSFLFTLEKGGEEDQSKKVQVDMRPEEVDGELRYKPYVHTPGTKAQEKRTILGLLKRIRQLQGVQFFMDNLWEDDKK